MDRKYAYLFLVMMGFLLFSSCEKVIDIDVKDAAPRVVIEGTVTNRTDTQLVKITRSAVLGDPNVFPGVSGAVVYVSDNLGNNFRFFERAPGVYSSRRLRGIPGRTYTLNVTLDNEVYQATSVMPESVRLDSLGITSTTFFDNERKSVQVLYHDPPEKPNYYRFVLTINKAPVRSIFVFNDDFNDGRRVVRELFDLDTELESGDEAEIEMQCIDKAVFRYWQGLDQNRNRGGASTTPANPVSNISNGALGYFSAHTKQTESLTVP